jgi:hypothetical protein
LYHQSIQAGLTFPSVSVSLLSLHHISTHNHLATFLFSYWENELSQCTKRVGCDRTSVYDLRIIRFSLFQPLLGGFDHIDTLANPHILTLSLSSYSLTARGILSFYGIDLGIWHDYSPQHPLLRLFNLRSYYISSFLYCRASFTFPFLQTPARLTFLLPAVSIIVVIVSLSPHSYTRFLPHSSFPPPLEQEDYGVAPSPFLCYRLSDFPCLMIMMTTMYCWFPSSYHS